MRVVTVAQPLSPTSDRRASARRFGAELDRAMAKRAIGRRRLAAATGVSGSGIAAYRAGNNLPRHETAIRLAEALDWPSLINLSREARTKACEVCGKAMLVASSIKIYCDSSCQKTAEKRRERSVPARIMAEPLRRKLTMVEDCVDAYCHACEPEGLCHDRSCPLRAVSPLNLANPTINRGVPQPPAGILPITLAPRPSAMRVVASVRRVG